jgi:hypothetical protein
MLNVSQMGHVPHKNLQSAAFSVNKLGEYNSLSNPEATV